MSRYNILTPQNYHLQTTTSKKMANAFNCVREFSSKLFISKSLVIKKKKKKSLALK